MNEYYTLINNKNSKKERKELYNDLLLHDVNYTKDIFSMMLQRITLFAFMLIKKNVVLYF